MLPEILPPIDAEISALMRKELARRGVDIAVGAKVDRIEPGVTVHYTQGGARSVTAEACIVAVGRRPVTDGLNLEAAGVALSRGFVVVDEYLKTNVPGIWAIGDVTGKVQLAHVASAQALVAAEGIAGATRRMDYGMVPSCVYTEPEIASIGLSEGQAKEKGLAYKVGRFATAANGRSMIMGETAGTVKLIVEEKTGELLGCHIMAPRATDIIGEIGAAMRSEGTLDELSDTIHAHPTVSEMIMEAAHAAQGHGIHQ
jgi:dihydrolipoamide dehydrogenase